MAWQLIYTSAPRLLEAGRSGFGTVARHRAIHPILVAALERDSQFDRNAVRGRVVFAHRIIAAGGARYHVLSCIRETGADYTGRTNHIAHHLIIDPREVSLLGGATPSPMDVCREMTWRTAWSDAPKWLEASEEISVSQFHPAKMPGGNWQAIAGDARYAGVLRPTTGSALVLPPEADALALFSESGAVAASQSWQATFTTCIQPTDDLSEFRWVAVEAVAPVRERAVGGRTVLDLTAPETLPAPPESRSKLFIPTPDAVLPTPSSLAEKSNTKPVSNLFDDQLAAHAPRAQIRERRKLGLLPYIVALVVLAGAAIYYGVILFAESPELAAQRTKVREDVNAAFPGTGMETAQTLSQVSKEQLPAALAIARTARETHEALQKQSLPQINVETAREKAMAVSLNTPQPIGRIFHLYSTHFDFQKRMEKLRTSTPEVIHLEELVRELSELWSTADQYTDPQSKNLREPAMKSVESLWAGRLRDVLNAKKPPAENPDMFDKQLNSLPASLRESKDTKNANEDAKKLIKDWRAVEAAGGDEKNLRALIAEGRETWPDWLKGKANAKIESKLKQVGSPGLPQTDTPKPENVAATSASKPFEGGLIIVTKPTETGEWEKFAEELAKGNYELYIKGKPNPLSGADKGKFRFGAGNTVFSFNKNDMLFQATADAQQPPYELELKRDKKAVLTAWVLQAGEPFHRMDGGLVRKGDEIHVQDVFSRSLCKLAKERVWDLALSSANWLQEEGVNADGKVSIVPKLETLKKNIEQLKGDLESQKKISKGNELPDNLKKAVKKMEDYANSSFKKPKTEDEIGKIKEDENRKMEKNYAARFKNAVPPKPNDSSSMGDFFKLASSGSPVIDGLFPIGDALEKRSKDVTAALPDALKVLAEVEKDLNERAQVRAGGNSKENEAIQNERNKAKAEIGRLKSLKEFLTAIQTLPATRKSAEAEIPKTQQEIDVRLKHPLLKPDYLPPGEYTISVKPPSSASALPFIRFTIKP